MQNGWQLWVEDLEYGHLLGVGLQQAHWRQGLLCINAAADLLVMCLMHCLQPPEHSFTAHPLCLLHLTSILLCLQVASVLGCSKRSIVAATAEDCMALGFAPGNFQDECCSEVQYSDCWGVP